MKTILLVGEAGTGKTWVMLQLLQYLKITNVGRVGMVLFHRNDEVLILGKYDSTLFQGSDRLSMAVMRDLPMFQAYVKDKKFRMVVCEGDRFTNKTFIEGMEPYIIKINGDGKEGRLKRGSNQTERQLKSIATRVSNIKEDLLVEKSSTALKVIKDILDGKKNV